MKTLFSTLLVLVAMVSCNCQKATTSQSNLTSNETMKQTQEIPVLEYEALTRGSYHKITIENNKVMVILGRGAKPIAFDITSEDLVNLAELYSKVDKEGLQNLKAPTEKRFYDGAAIAHFRVIEGDKTYESCAFDGGFPPAEIKEIVDKIIEVSEKK